MHALSEVINVAAAEWKVPPRQLSATSLLKRDLGADSLDILSLVSRLERRFNVRFSDEAIAEIDTLQHVAELIEDGAGCSESGERVRTAGSDQ